MKRIALVVALLILGLSAEPQAGASPALAWKDECGDPSWEGATDNYCACVGKVVKDSTTKLKVGKIIGVAWRPKGSLIGNSDLRVSSRNAFFYIVDDGMPNTFLKDPRQALFSNGRRLWCE